MKINSTKIFASKNNFTLVDGRMLFCYIKDITQNSPERMYETFTNECIDPNKNGSIHNPNNLTTVWTLVSNSDSSPD